jgi:predicted nucleotidyltransferase
MIVDEIYLFGSHARGEAGPDSDLDIGVIVPFATESRYQRTVRARGLVGDIEVAKDIVILTRQEWEEERAVVGSLANTIAREGIALHG